MASIKALSTGKPADLSITGELSEIADSVNQASRVLSRQNEARANWISGVSHDIRTPLSMIMGYAQRISSDGAANKNIQQEAEIIQTQSAKIKDLVQDLNLVSQLEYEMQPLHKEAVHLSKLLRSYAADLLNAGIGPEYSVEVEVSPEAESIVIECDARLISRAINNLVQNSIKHNPQGCAIRLCLDCSESTISLSVRDNGMGWGFCWCGRLWKVMAVNQSLLLPFGKYSIFSEGEQGKKKIGKPRQEFVDFWRARLVRYSR